jgi:thioredoxin 1
MAPVIEEFAKKYDGKMIIGSCNVDESEELTAKFGIRNIPAIFFLKEGQIVDKIIGAVTPAAVEEKIQALL